SQRHISRHALDTVGVSVPGVPAVPELLGESELERDHPALLWCRRADWLDGGRAAGCAKAGYAECLGWGAARYLRLAPLFLIGHRKAGSRPVVALGPLLGAGSGRLRTQLSSRSLGHHVDDHEVGDAGRGSYALLAGVTRMQSHGRSFPERCVLRIFTPNRIVLVRAQRLREVAQRRSLPRLVLIAL